MVGLDWIGKALDTNLQGIGSISNNHDLEATNKLATDTKAMLI